MSYTEIASISTAIIIAVVFIFFLTRKNTVKQPKKTSISVVNALSAFFNGDDNTAIDILKDIAFKVVMIGKIIKYGEISLRKIFRKGAVSETIAGTILTLFVIIISFIIPYIILSICYSINMILGISVEIFMCFQLLALGSLKEAAMKIYTELSTGSLNGARKNLTHIVGRDTENLDEKSVIKASVESVAENTSDGVIAPLFYMLIGGASFGMLYKAVNTLDSMIGYKNKKYQYKGICHVALTKMETLIFLKEYIE